MNALQKELFSLQDSDYKKFQSKLIPTINPETVIGIRIPVLRKFAKSFSKSSEADKFISKLPHEYYEENLLHMILLSYEKDYDLWISRMEKFVSNIDNWAVCDMSTPKCLKQNHETLLPKIKCWIKSDHPYTIRFGIELLMKEFLDDDFSPEFLNIVASVKSNEYYVNMMIAWYFATALAKQWSRAIPVIENQKLEKWTHNKSIQKSIESFRITDEKKNYLRTLRR